VPPLTHDDPPPTIRARIVAAKSRELVVSAVPLDEVKSGSSM